MSDHDSSSGSNMGLFGGIGAVVLAAAAGLARFGDDALRIFAGHADDVGRAAAHGADEMGQGLAHGADDFGRGAMHAGNEIGGIPKLSDPSIITHADDAVQTRVHVPSHLLRPSTYGQGAEDAPPNEKANRQVKLK
jgi:hypothetical protein